MTTASVNEKSDARSNVERAAEVFDKYGYFIRSVIRFHVRDEAEAEDLFQDLFLFFIAKPMPQEVQNGKSFLYKVISDAIKNVFRRVDRYQAMVRRYATRNVHTVEKRPENVIMEIEEMKNMFELIERHLPTYEALAVELRYKDNCDIGEAAKQMRVKPRTVSRYVSAGLEKIRCFLGEKQRNNL